MSPKWEVLQSRSEQTTKAAKAIVDAESSDRAAKTARLRKARLAAKSETLSAHPKSTTDRTGTA
jgi:hypothetical protein